MSLLTKTQLKDYEPGEFSDIKQRSWPETRELIEQFPWSAERDHFTVSLTSPSITIEGSSGDYLKLALYYNNKFILYYLDTENHLYTHSISTPSESYPIIQSFFEGSCDPTAFTRQRTPFINNRTHFVTKNFDYTMHGTYVPFFIFFASVLSLIFPSMTILVGLKQPSSMPIAGFIILSAISLLFIGWGIFIVSVCINHYRASRNKILTISQGNPLFYYGDIGSPAVYDKKDIQEIISRIGSKSNNRLARSEIVFKDGSSINISGLILPSDILSAKFPHQDHNYRPSVFSYFIPPSSSTPS